MKKWNKLLVCTAVLVMSLGSAPIALAAEGSVAEVNTEELPESPVKENNEIIDQAATSSESVAATNASVEPEVSSSQTTSSEAMETTPASSETAETSTEPVKEVKTVESTEASEEPEQTEDEDYFFDAWAFNRGRSDLYDAEAENASPRARIAASPTGIQAIYPDKNKNTPKMDFIDVSSHNGSISVAQYQSMKKYGVKAVVVKLTEATSYQNEYAEKQIKNAQAAGLIVHAYHYSWFTSTASAKAEAAYFVNYAKKIGLPRTAYMINDMEEPKIMGKGNHTNDSLEFVKEIKRLGYSNTKHYIGQWWITGGTINATKLGNKACWVAAYPLKPTASMLNNNAYDSWQWSSQVYMPGISFPFDMSVDYTGDLTTKGGGTPGDYISVGQYMTIDEEGPIYSNFNWATSKNTSSLIGTTVSARGKYNHSNGITYYSIWDNKGKWIGYVDGCLGMSPTPNPQGRKLAGKNYIKIKDASVNLTSDFGSKVKTKGSDIVDQELIDDGYYSHFDGTIYYSIFDANGKWYGYVKATDVIVQPAQGQPTPLNKYFTFTQKDHAIYQDFSRASGTSSTNYLNKTYLAKNLHHHINGYDYYAIHDNKNSFIGYVYKVAGVITDNPGGVWQKESTVVATENTSEHTYSDFKFKIKHKASEIQNKVFKVTGKYVHYNGSTYYSLYDENDKWYGYIAQSGVKNLGPQGQPAKIEKYVSLNKKNQKIYSDFNGKVIATSDKYLNKTFKIKELYQHLNGKDYYAIYDGNNKFVGYIDTTTGTIAKNQGGIWYSEKQYVKVTKPWNAYSNFQGFVVKNAGAKLIGQTYRVKGKYTAVNGSTYYSLYDLNDKWFGYINRSATSRIGDQGQYHKYGKYFTTTKSSGKLYGNFSWKSKGNLAKYLNTTLEAKGIYHHLNGKQYLSLYNNKGTWVGYTEATNGKTTTNPGGHWRKESITVKVSKSNYPSYSNFYFKKKNTGASLHNKTFKVTGKYYHKNGSTYYSLYDSHGKWYGYINKNATKKI